MRGETWRARFACVTGDDNPGARLDGEANDIRGDQDPFALKIDAGQHLIRC